VLARGQQIAALPPSFVGRCVITSKTTTPPWAAAALRRLSRAGLAVQPSSGSRRVQLDDDSVERVAQRLAELLRPAAFRTTPDLVDAATLADLLGVSRSTIYQHAKALGGERIGTGPRAPLRFDPEVARAAMAEMGSADPRPAARARSRRRTRRPEQHAVGSVLQVKGGAR